MKYKVYYSKIHDAIFILGNRDGWIESNNIELLKQIQSTYSWAQVSLPVIVAISRDYENLGEL